VIKELDLAIEKWRKIWFYKKIQKVLLSFELNQN